MPSSRDTIHECPYCRGRARREARKCGRSFGPKVWSDGFMDEAIPWEDVRVTRCPQCSGMYWLEDARVRGEVPHPTYSGVEIKVKRTWWLGTRTEIHRTLKAHPLSTLPKLIHPDRTGLQEALADLRPDHDPEREAYLRTRLWWAHNHRLRYHSLEQPTEREIALNHRNLSQLLPLYGPHDEPARLMLAGILLSLERFGDAKAIADLMDHYKWVPYKAKFIAAAEQRRSEVFRVR